MGYRKMIILILFAHLVMNIPKNLNVEPHPLPPKFPKIIKSFNTYVLYSQDVSQEEYSKQLGP